MTAVLKRILPIILLGASAVQVAGADVTIAILDEATGQHVPGRVHLFDGRGKPVQPEGVTFYWDNFVIDGQIRMSLPDGNYRYQIERGAEWTRDSGTFGVEGNRSVAVESRLRRFVDMNARGWYSGDLHVHNPLRDVPLLMRAEDLNVAPVITWWNDKDQWANRPLPSNLLVHFEPNRYYRVLAGEDERAGGALLFANLDEPLPIHGLEPEYLPSWHFLHMGKKQPNAHVDIEKPFWLDTPMWAASGLVDSVGICHNHMHRAKVYDNEAWGNRRDREKYPGPHGNALWTHDIYFHLLNSGLRLPPSAGSSCGAQPVPLGYNRVYVYLPDGLTWDGWWQGLKEGRSFVTNGPMLWVTANSQPPGHVFTAREGKSVKIDLQAEFMSLDPIKLLQVIVNGKVVREVRPYPDTSQVYLGELRFETSGWFMIRAVADISQTYRFAATAPSYIEIGDKPYISRASVEFFLDWIAKRRAAIEAAVKDGRKLVEILNYVDNAERFWKERLIQATIR